MSKIKKKFISFVITFDLIMNAFLAGILQAAGQAFFNFLRKKKKESKNEKS